MPKFEYDKYKWKITLAKLPKGLVISFITTITNKINLKYWAQSPFLKITYIMDVVRRLVLKT